jgi:EAL domain-containing protein (putative c-di-GMP-specific phosphodiesterase class I)
LGPIATAIEQDELFLAYQPQVSAQTGVIVSVETLVRWRHPTRGLLAPGAFVAAAEKSGEIEQLGAWVLRKACHEATAWSSLATAVNVSPRQFCGPNFVPLVLDALHQSGLPPHRLEIEITESAYFEDPDRAIAELLELRSHGIRIALDDFGTGYASISLLRLLPLDKIKIDKSFVDAINRSDGAAIVQAVVSLARALDLEVTAEGVQTQDQQRFLRDIGCHYLQGYLYSEPVGAADLSLLLATSSAHF